MSKEKLQEIKAGAIYIKEAPVVNYYLFEGHFVPFEYVIDVDISTKTVYIISGRVLQTRSVQDFADFYNALLEWRKHGK